MNKISFDVISEEEIEKIAYETSFLLSRGWKRVWSYDVPSIKEFLLSIDKRDCRSKIPDYVWIKDIATRQCWYSEVVDTFGRDSGDRIIIDWFDRFSAVEYESQILEKSI